MKSNPRKKAAIKVVRLPKTNRFIFETDECDVIFHFKEGNKPTNAMINWMIDRVKLEVHR